MTDGGLDGVTAPQVSVCIPMRNMASDIAAQLHALRSQTTDRRFEVVIADDGSTDGSADVALGASQELELRVVPVHGRGINCARNAAVEAANGDHVLLCDADDVVDEGFVHALSRGLDKAELVGGVAVVWTNGVAGREIPSQRRYDFLSSPIGACFGFRRTVWTELGGFDEAFKSGADETEFVFRAQLAGFRLVHVPEARIRYQQPDRTVWESFLRAYRRSGSDVQMFVKFRDDGMPRTSTKRAMRTLLVAVTGLVFPARLGTRREAARILGRSMGHLVASARERCWYP